MRTLGPIAGFLLLGLFALIMAGQFIGFATSGSLSGDAQTLFSDFVTIIYGIGAVAFGGLVLAAFWQFVFKHGRR